MRDEGKEQQLKSKRKSAGTGWVTSKRNGVVEQLSELIYVVTSSNLNGNA